MKSGVDMINQKTAIFVEKYAPEILSMIRPLSEEECDHLIRNGNRAQSWETIAVFDNFNPDFIYNCRFYETVIIGGWTRNKDNPYGFKFPSGLYNSTICNSIIKNDVSMDSLLYCNFYKIENDVIIHNIGDLFTNEFASFGNGIHSNSDYKWIDLINENGGRAILPFNGMTTADAYLWAKFRNDKAFLDQLTKITESTCTPFINTIGTVDSFAIVKNISHISDTYVGKHAQLQECISIVNSTIRSTESEPTVVGAGVQLQDAIVGYSNHIDSGVQLSSVVTGSGVSIHQTARISHSFIGDNSAIGCCEIANSLILPSHGQHHNNSFLIAAMIGGQSNIAAGATIGSNHNSRTNDGELWASRGFWPGLCCSFKHNSRFASFVMCAKADYPAELDIPFPFSLISNDSSKDQLIIYPAFWFIHNMYSFIRSKGKFIKRDKRISRELHIEHNPLAPDTIEEIFSAMRYLECMAVNQFYPDHVTTGNVDLFSKKAKEIFLNQGHISSLQTKRQFEKSDRITQILDPSTAWNSYLSIVRWYAASTVISYINQSKNSFQLIPIPKRKTQWINCGGQIICHDDLTTLISEIKSNNTIKDWSAIHSRLSEINGNYAYQKFLHALGCFAAIEGVDESQFTQDHLKTALRNTIITCKQIPELARKSRIKDFTDNFRSMIYSSDNEMKEVLGDINSDSYIINLEEEINELITAIESYIEL